MGTHLNYKTPELDSIIADYSIVQEYAKEAATIVDPLIIRKKFKSHVKANTSDHDLIWGRDKWYALDSLPLSFRTMVNDDPVDPDSALVAATQLWMAIVVEAEKAMDHVINYEKSYKDFQSFPDFLKSVPSQEMRAIEELYQKRMANENALKEARARERETMRTQEEVRSRLNHMSLNDVARMYRAHRYVTGDGQSLRHINTVNTSGMRPHEIRALQEQGAKPLTFKAIDYVGLMKPGNAQELADKEDRLPPVKAHPIHQKRGKNY